MGNIDYEGEVLLILLNILVTSFVCMAFQCREVSVPKKMMYRDGGSDSDEMPPSLPVGDEMDCCWLDFGKKVYVNPKGVVIHLVPSCEHINHGRCRELGIRLDCVDCLANVKKRPKTTMTSTRTAHGRRRTKKFVTNRGVEGASDVPVCVCFVLFIS